MAVFEGVFSELLDSAATSFQRDNAGDWQIEALFTSTPDDHHRSNACTAV